MRLLFDSFADGPHRPRRRATFALLSAAIVSCATTKQESPPAPVPSAQSAQDPIAAGSGDPKCANAEAQERIVIPTGVTVVTSVGLAVRFAGTQIDHFDDGRHDTLVGLSIIDEEGADSGWLPSVHEPAVYRAFGMACLKLVSATEAEVILDVAAAQASLPPCHPSCCSSSERGPAPGGEVECCFCGEQHAL